MHRDLLPSNIQRSLYALSERQLFLPALLFLAAHRPLAFIAGQMLYLGAPLAEMFVGPAWSDWATLFSARHGPQLLEQYLRAEPAQDETEQPT